MILRLFGWNFSSKCQDHYLEFFFFSFFHLEFCCLKLFRGGVVNPEATVVVGKTCLYLFFLHFSWPPIPLFFTYSSSFSFLSLFTPPPFGSIVLSSFSPKYSRNDQLFYTSPSSQFLDSYFALILINVLKFFKLEVDHTSFLFLLKLLLEMRRVFLRVMGWVIWQRMHPRQVLGTQS